MEGGMAKRKVTKSGDRKTDGAWFGSSAVVLASSFHFYGFQVPKLNCSPKVFDGRF